MTSRQTDIGVEHVKLWAKDSGHLDQEDIFISADVDEVMSPLALHQLRSRLYFFSHQILCHTIPCIKTRQMNQYGYQYRHGAKVGILSKQNERNSSSHLYIWFVFYVSLPHEIKLLLFNLFFFA